jgi:glycosyltransferase involved in cell wall biosynthesis
LFPFRLRARVRGFDLVHVCDHSNSMYLAHTGGRPASITCHDLLAIGSALGRYPQQRTSASGKVQQRWILKHLAAARNVVCVSTNTARELTALSEGELNRVVVIPNAVELNCSPASEESVQRLRDKLGIAADERYLFHIGGNLWYKNRLGVLRIFQMIRGSASRVRLVMAGAPLSAEMRDFIAANLPEGSVIEVVNPTDEELWCLYSGAAALLFPSLYEGFGWPLIEAQRCGCPVITSNRAPMTEVAGAAAIYIDPEDEIAAAKTIAENLDTLGRLRESGFKNVERFDPAVVIPAYEGFFRGVLRTRRSTDGRVVESDAGAIPHESRDA